MTLFARCLDCAVEYETEDVKDYGLCLKCLAGERRALAADFAEGETEPLPWSRAWMRERLGVSGNLDE